MISLTGAIELWHVVVLVAVYGVGQALFAPVHEATIPEIVPRPLLLQANSLYELAEPIAYRFAGPAIAFLLVPGLRDPERWVEEERREAELLAAAQGDRA